MFWSNYGYIFIIDYFINYLWILLFIYEYAIGHIALAGKSVLNQACYLLPEKKLI